MNLHQADGILFGTWNGDHSSQIHVVCLDVNIYHIYMTIYEYNIYIYILPSAGACSTRMFIALVGLLELITYLYYYSTC